MRRQDINTHPCSQLNQPSWTVAEPCRGYALSHPSEVLIKVAELALKSTIIQEITDKNGSVDKEGGDAAYFLSLQEL